MHSLNENPKPIDQLDEIEKYAKIGCNKKERILFEKTQQLLDEYTLIEIKQKFDQKKALK